MSTATDAARDLITAINTRDADALTGMLADDVVVEYVTLHSLGGAHRPAPPRRRMARDPIMGILEMNAGGQLTLMRDYFDPRLAL